MRSVALIIVLIAAHFTSGHAQAPTFDTTANLVYPAANTAAAPASNPNGILINLGVDGAGKAFSWVISKPLSTTALSDFYVTLVCATGPVDIGPVIGTTAPALANAAALEAGAATTGWVSDIISVNSPGVITGSTTTDQYVIAPGQTVRYTFDPTNTAGTLYAVTIRDVTGNTLQKTPCNAGGVAGGQSGKCSSFTKTAGVQMGFEVLNKGTAYICVQTPTQWAAGNSCDSEATKFSTCTTGTLATTYTAAAKCTNNLYQNQCVASCPTGTYVYGGTAATAGCVDCNAALTTNFFCASSKTVVRDSPLTSSSALLRVGQIAAIFVGSIYFVLFA